MRSAILLALFSGLVHGGLLPDDLYERLGVDKEANDRSIHSSFKKLAVKYHPDKNAQDTNAHGKMVEINEALSILSDPDLRKAYDANGMEGVKTAKVKGTQGGADAKFQTLQFYENSELYTDDSQITLIDYHNWEASHSSSDAWFITFYEPDCEKCTDMADDWRRLGSRFQGIYNVGAVNCMRDFPICRQLGVLEFPTTLLFVAGQPRNKQAPIRVTDMSYDNMEKLAKEHLPNVVQPLLPENYIASSQIPFGEEKGDLWLIGFCSNSDSCATTETHLREASLVGKGLMPIGQVSCEAYAALCQRLNQDPARSPEGAHYIAYYSNGQKQQFPQGKSVVDMAHFILSQLPPLNRMTIDELYQVSENMMAHKHVGKTIEKPKEYLILVVDQGRCENEASNFHSECNSAMTSLRQVAMALESDWEYSELTITTFDCGPRGGDKRLDLLCTELGVEPGPEPTLVLMKDGALGPSEFHDQVNQPNQVLAFVQMAFKSAVHEISSEDLELHVNKENQTWFVDFYAPWCHHCRDVWPEWNLASRHYDLPKNYEVHFGKINCEDHHDVCQQYHIRGYPTFLLFHEGVRHQFDFDFRTSEEFVRFVKETLEPVEYEFTPETYTKMIADPAMRHKPVPPPEEEEDQRWVVDFFAPWCSHCHVMSPKFREAASVLRGVVKFGKLNCELDSSYCMQLGIRAYPTIWRFDAGQPRNRPTAQYPGLPDPKLILDFALAGVPDYVEKTEAANMKKLLNTMDDTTSIIVLYWSSKDCETCEQSQLKIKALASRYTEKENRQLKEVQRADPIKETKMVQVRFHSFNCRAGGSAFTFCIGEKIKKHPTLAYYSGLNNGKQTIIAGLDDNLKLISEIDGLIEADRREMTHPFRVTKSSYHEDL